MRENDAVIHKVQHITAIEPKSQVVPPLTTTTTTEPRKSSGPLTTCGRRIGTVPMNQRFVPIGSSQLF